MSPSQLQRLIADAARHLQSGHLVEAERLYGMLRRELPGNFDVLQFSGAVALQLGKPGEAAGWFEQALAINPRSALGAMRLGAALMAGGRASEAERQLRQAVRMDPNLADAWTNLAQCLRMLDRLAEALDCHRRALALQPRSASGWYHHGLSLMAAEQFDEALAASERALAEDPGLALGHYGRALALHRLHRLSEAVEAYDRYLALASGGHEARSYRLLALNHLDTITREQLFAEHVAFGRAVGESPRPAFANLRDPARRLRVAILSPDLRVHSCAWFLAPLVRHLDRGSFELYLYHDHPREDDVSAGFRREAAVWRNFVGQPNAAVEVAIRKDAPDILIDLAGHTGATTRLSLFTRHLAPVQINYLGYPNTTGLPAMQYRFTDAVADPEGEADAFATERLVRFSPSAWAYQPPEDAPEPGAPPVVAGGPVTFGCFNNPAKINPTTARLWAGALAAVPGSRLLLKGYGLEEASTRRRQSALFAGAGLPADRIEFAARTPDIASHLAHYRRVDIALDTYPYHGATTTCEALWMGVPVVTLGGDRHASRVGASLLTAVGHADWVATDEAGYARIAAALVGDPEGLAGLRRGLRGDMRASVLLDHAGQAARFGAALRRCWEDCCRGGHAGRAISPRG